MRIVFPVSRKKLIIGSAGVLSHIKGWASPILKITFNLPIDAHPVLPRSVSRPERTINPAFRPAPIYFVRPTASPALAVRRDGPPNGHHSQVTANLGNFHRPMPPVSPVPSGHGAREISRPVGPRSNETAFLEPCYYPKRPANVPERGRYGRVPPAFAFSAPTLAHLPAARRRSACAQRCMALACPLLFREFWMRFDLPNL